ncbi:glycerophosphodiester phosphodiesterase [Flaviaesturariibacter flavus]|uniref:Glycerophosphodiester phosphodiesterase n=1 Tax=Flaviaesturariibacter flavus TaxID=2502780 RepID=A0A4R1B7P0_9BACT|nr:glycerophosphodiester phosphodiesterase family protein [Flaviaesturariibacter flavus]TCJ12618.1 glycerophosphodiester phosphodiesterase [Flaviaesturariibacter flavus]
MKRLFPILLLLILGACRRQYDVRVPDTTWAEFNAPGTQRLEAATYARLQGIYTINSGNSRFGNNAVMRWSYDAAGADTTYYLSIFCEKDVTWFLLQGRRQDSVILLNGYWRRMAGTDTGPARLTVGRATGGSLLLGSDSLQPGAVVINGVYGEPGAPIQEAVQFSRQRPLPARELEVVVHRGGGQSADLLPASENSAEIIPYASLFGATGIEIDVRMTRDGVPILYHDATLSERLIVKNGMVGPVENYTYAQLSALVRLIRNNERIPTLREALDVVVRRTPLRFVWLDTKFNGSLQPIRDLQAEFGQRAAALGKPLEIVIGIPDRDVLSNFLALPGYNAIPSVVELDPADAATVNARIWAPRWTLGLQNAEVTAVQAQGRRAFVWTLDQGQNIDLFLREGHFNGILTNYPTEVAYHSYVQP